MSASLDLYRALVPAHAAVPDATVEVWLAQAAQAHTATAWGNVYTTAMVWWAAAHIDLQVQAGQFPTDATCAPVPITDPAKLPKNADETVYWGWYLRLQSTRAAAAPTIARVGC